MDTLIELGRRAGEAALADAAAVADPDEGLRRIRDDTSAMVTVPDRSVRHRTRRPWLLGGAAAAVVAGVIAASIVIAGRDDAPHLSPVPTPTPISTTATTSTAPTTSTTVPAWTAPPAEVLALCSKGPLTIVRTLVDRRLSGEGSTDCLDPTAFPATGPACWSVCGDGRLTDAGVGDPTEVVVPSGDGAATGWSVPVVLTYTDEFGFRTQHLERWTLLSDPAGASAVTAIDLAMTDSGTGEALTIANDYFDALARADYDTAAALLDDGALDLAERVDLQPLRPGYPDDLAGALRAWCEEPAAGTGAQGACTRPSDVVAGLDVGGAIVTAWWVVDGRVVSAVVHPARSEGVATIRGLPPRVEPLDAGDVATMASALGASRMVVATDTGFWLAADGQATFVDTGESGTPSLGGDFAYWTTWTDANARSMAFTSDGVQVCAVEGIIDHVRARADGTYVATVERPTPDQYGAIAETPVPAFAVDCASGDTQPIAPISWTAEASSRRTSSVGGRIFTIDGDVEGGVAITNDAGVSVTGPDTAISADFTADGTTVVYGEGGGANPGIHDTNRLVARDTTSGAIVWSVSLPRRFSTLWVVGGQVVVPHTPGPLSFVSDEYTIVDLASGGVLATVPAVAQIAGIE